MLTEILNFKVKL